MTDGTTTADIMGHTVTYVTGSGARLKVHGFHRANDESWKDGPSEAAQVISAEETSQQETMQRQFGG